MTYATSAAPAAPAASWAPTAPVTEYDPEIGYRFIASTREEMPHERGRYVVVTNRDHLRSSRDYAPERPAGTARLIATGDSFTAGDGVDNHERFTDRLEARWATPAAQASPAGESGSGAGLEVINCALPGSGTDQQLLLLQRYAARYEYDALLLCPLLENVRRNVARYRLARDRRNGDAVAVAKPYFTLEGDRLVRHHQPVPAEPVPLADLPRDLLAYVDFGGARATSWLRGLVNRYAQPLKPWLIGLGRFQPHPEYDDPASPAWRLMAALLREAIAASAGKPTLLVPLPYYVQIEHPQTANHLPRFRELVEEYRMSSSSSGKVVLVDVLPAFWRLSAVDRRRCRYQDDIHYTPFAHEIVAKEVERACLDEGLLP